MKKVFKSAMLLAIGSALVVSSCKKADEATPLENATSTATIKGQLFCDKDLTNDSKGSDFVNTDAASDAKIKVTTYSDIEGDGDAIVKIVSVDGSGNFSFTVPAVGNGATVEIEALDYETSQKFNYNDGGTQKEATESGYFPGKSIDEVTVYPGQTKLLGKTTLSGFKSTQNPSKLAGL